MTEFDVYIQVFRAIDRAGGIEWSCLPDIFRARYEPKKRGDSDSPIQILETRKRWWSRKELPKEIPKEHTVNKVVGLEYINDYPYLVFENNERKINKICSVTGPMPLSYEQAVILSVSQNGQVFSHDDMVNVSGLPLATVRSAMEALENYGLLEVAREEISRIVTLTPLGQLYAEFGETVESALLKYIERWSKELGGGVPMSYIFGTP